MGRRRSSQVSDSYVSPVTRVPTGESLAGEGGGPPYRPLSFLRNDSRWSQLEADIRAGHIDHNSDLDSAAITAIFRYPPLDNLQLPVWFMEHHSDYFWGFQYRTREELDAAIQEHEQRWRDAIETLRINPNHLIYIRGPPPEGIPLPPIIQQWVDYDGLGQQIPLDWHWQPRPTPDQHVGSFSQAPDLEAEHQEGGHSPTHSS